MDDDEKKRERRKQRRLEALCTNHPVCLACALSDWRCIYDGHHVAGRRFDNHTELFCANCHRRLSEMQKSHPKPTSKSPGTVECAGHYCLGLADIFQLSSRMLEQFGHGLVELSAGGELESDVAKQFVRDAGHVFIALARFLEKAAERLRHYGNALTNEATQAAGDGYKAR